MRDNYRDRLYKAERSVFGSYDDPAAWHSPADLADLARSYETLPAIAGRLAPNERISAEVSTRSARSRSWSHRKLVRMSSQQRAAWVLTHEIAHLFIPDQFPAHGREYATFYLSLVRDVHGDLAADRLADAFTEVGVPFGARPADHAKQVAAMIERGVRNDWPIRLVNNSGDGFLIYRRPIAEQVRLLDGYVTWTDSKTGMDKVSLLDNIAYATVDREPVGVPVARTCRDCGAPFATSGKRGRPPVKCVSCRATRKTPVVTTV